MQQIVRTITLAYNNLPRPHRIMLGSLTVMTLAVAVWRPFIYHPEHEPVAKSVVLDTSQSRIYCQKPVNLSISQRLTMQSHKMN